MTPTPAITDEQLMAYADGELDAPMREVVEAALAADPALVSRLAAHEALRERLRGAFAAELDEPVPARLRRICASTIRKATPKRCPSLTHSLISSSACSA